MNSKINGNILCDNEEGLNKCKALLNRFYIKYECKEKNIDIDCKIRVRAMFDNEGFNKMLHYKLNQHGKAKINVGCTE